MSDMCAACAVPPDKLSSCSASPDFSSKIEKPNSTSGLVALKYIATAHKPRLLQGKGCRRRDTSGAGTGVGAGVGAGVGGAGVGVGVGMSVGVGVGIVVGTGVGNRVWKNGCNVALGSGAGVGALVNVRIGAGVVHRGKLSHSSLFVPIGHSLPPRRGGVRCLRLTLITRDVETPYSGMLP